KKELSVFLGSIFTFISCLFILGAVISYLLTSYWQTEHNAYFIFLLRLGIILLGAQTGYSFVMLVLQVNRQSLKYSVYSSIKVVGLLATTIFIYYFIVKGVEAILIAAIIFVGGIFLVEMVQFIRKWQIKFFPVSREIVKKIISFGGPHIGVLFGAWALAQADRYMLNYFMNTEAVGIYSAGYRVAQVGMQVLYAILFLTALPIIVQTYEKEGVAKVRETLRSFIGLYLLFLVPAVFGIVVLSKDLAYILLGESFRSSFKIVPWITVGIFFLGLSQYVTITFQLKEKPLYLVFLMLGAGLLNIVLNIFMIPAWGIKGAAVATLIAYAVCVVIAWLISIKMISLKMPWAVLVKSLLAAAFMYYILWLVAGYWLTGISISFLLAKVIIGAGLYFAVIYLLKEKTFRGLVNSRRSR
ncbi:MAG: polysaccharide biosynthesis C-terminal domain-containing protein, partial [Planctomycetes bacterium]|nr:polysaccharide biosynthesis C-terminal domain-containing protein [Planctomycetota bacterium]